MHRQGFRQLLRARGRAAGGLLVRWQLAAGWVRVRVRVRVRIRVGVRVRARVRVSAPGSPGSSRRSPSRSSPRPSRPASRLRDARHDARCGRVSESDSARWAIRQEKRTCVDVRLDHALAGRPARLLVDRRQALGAQSLRGSINVALRLHQRLLAVHHAGARLIAQGLDRLRVDLDCCAGQGSTRVKTPTRAGAGWLCAAPSIVNGEKRGAVATERVDATGIMSEAADSTATRHSAHRSMVSDVGAISKGWVISWKVGGALRGRLRLLLPSSLLCFFGVGSLFGEILFLFVLLIRLKYSYFVTYFDRRYPPLSARHSPAAAPPATRAPHSRTGQWC